MNERSQRGPSVDAMKINIIIVVLTLECVV